MVACLALPVLLDGRGLPLPGCATGVSGSATDCAAAVAGSAATRLLAVAAALALPEELVGGTTS